MQDSGVSIGGVGSDLARIVTDERSAAATATVLLIGQPATELVEAIDHAVTVCADTRSVGEHSFDVVWLLDADPSTAEVTGAAELVGTTGRLIWRSTNPADFGQLARGQASAAETADHDVFAAVEALGLTAQHTLYPWPSAVEPTVVLSSALMDHPERLAVLAALRESVQPLGWVEADAQTDALANILCSPSAADLLPDRINIAAVDRQPFGATAWSTSRIGIDLWSAAHRLTLDGAALGEDTALGGETALTAGTALTRTSTSLAADSGRPQLGWLSFAPADNQAIPTGPTVLDEMLAALEANDVEQMGTVLKRWHSQLAALAVALESDSTSDGQPLNPYAVADGERIPGRYLDARLGNVVLEPELGLLAPGWHATGSVALSLVVTRGLWDFAHFLVTSGTRHPWSAVATVADLVQSLGELGGMSIGPAHLNSWQVAESALCARLFGGVDDDYLSWISSRSASSAADMTDELGPDALATITEDLSDRVDELQAELDTASSEIERLELALSAEREWAETAAEDAAWELSTVREDRDRLADKVEAQKLLTSEVLRKYERAVHERNMIEQGMNGYRQVVGVARKVMPTQVYFRVRKLVRGH